MKNVRLPLICLIIVFSQSGCTWFYPYQKIIFTTGDPKSEYYILNERVKPPVKKKRINKNLPLVITRTQEGYRTESQVLIPKKLDPIFGVTCVVFSPAPFLIPIEFLGPGRPFKHPSRMALDTTAMTFLPNSPLPNIRFEVSNFESLTEPIPCRSIKYLKFQHVEEEKMLNAGQLIYSPANPIEFPANKMEEILDDLLNSQKAQPKINALITPYAQKFNIEIAIKDLSIAEVKRGRMEKAYCNMVFKFSDRFGQKKDSLSYRVSSIWQTHLRRSSFLFQSFIEDGLTQLFLDPAFSELIKAIPASIESQIAILDTLQLQSHQSGYNLETAMKAQITLKNKDYLASGFMVSNEGHFITSYTNAMDVDSLEVVFPDGISKKPRVIRIDPVTNIALMQLDTIGIPTLKANHKGLPAIGSTIYAVGTPVNEWLNQSLTRGIVSSFRQIEGYNYIQTDTKSSYGNNGSPVINDSGELIGIMNDKLYFLSAEGLSMVVPISAILERLCIQIN